MRSDDKYGDYFHDQDGKKSRIELRLDPTDDIVTLNWTQRIVLAVCLFQFQIDRDLTLRLGSTIERDMLRF